MIIFVVVDPVSNSLGHMFVLFEWSTIILLKKNN
jgi:hypothetical protein